MAQVEFDRKQRARGVGDCRRRRDVAHPPERIARRLEPDELRLARPHGAPERGQVLRVDEIDLEAEALRVAREPASERPIHHGRRHDMDVALGVRAEAEEERDGGRHAGAEDERLGRALERADDGLGLARGLVVGTAVDVAAAIEIVGIAQEGRRHMDRRHERARRLVDDALRLGGERARPVGLRHKGAPRRSFGVRRAVPLASPTRRSFSRGARSTSLRPRSRTKRSGALSLEKR